MNNSSVGNVQRLQEVGAGMKEPHNERNTTHKILSMVMMELHSFFLVQENSHLKSASMRATQL